jgi:hypothetical protein
MIITYGNLKDVTFAKIVISGLEEQRKTTKNTTIFGVFDTTLNSVTF